MTYIINPKTVDILLTELMVMSEERATNVTSGHPWEFRFNISYGVDMDDLSSFLSTLRRLYDKMCEIKGGLKFILTRDENNNNLIMVRVMKGENLSCDVITGS